MAIPLFGAGDVDGAFINVLNGVVHNVPRCGGASERLCIFAHGFEFFRMLKQLINPIGQGGNVIGMKRAVKDKASIEFSVGFYDALGAGRSVENAFEFGKNAIALAFGNKAEDTIPVLFTRKENGKICQGFC